MSGNRQEAKQPKRTPSTGRPQNQDMGQGTDGGLRNQFGNVANQNNAMLFVPRNERQAEHAELIDNNSIIFSLGPAGTGKTHVAVFKAIEAYKAREAVKIVICRPLTPAGEDFGFVPGTKEEKMADWLIPIYDELDKAFGQKERKAMMTNGTIEIVPLAKVRGRTFPEGTIVIVDEAQNCSYKDLFTIATRLGEGSKMIINGDPDPDQIDLVPVERSGLAEIADEFKEVKGIAIHRYDETDCVRSAVVKEMLKVHKAKKEASSGNESVNPASALRRP